MRKATQKQLKLRRTMALILGQLASEFRMDCREVAKGSYKVKYLVPKPSPQPNEVFPFLQQWFLGLYKEWQAFLAKGKVQVPDVQITGVEYSESTGDWWSVTYSITCIK